MLDNVLFQVSFGSVKLSVGAKCEQKAQMHFRLIRQMTQMPILLPKKCTRKTSVNFYNRRVIIITGEKQNVLYDSFIMQIAMAILRYYSNFFGSSPNQTFKALFCCFANITLYTMRAMLFLIVIYNTRWRRLAR